MKSGYIFPVLLLLFLLLPVRNLTGQTLFVAKLNDLEFGDVFIGYSKEVQHMDIEAAKFRIYHTQWFRRTLYIDFNLPSNLANGGSQIPITFDQSHTAWGFFDQTDNRNNFDPHSTLVINNAWFYIPVFIWLGGTINTNTGLPYGLYTGTIIITVAY
jgi:hypothetical protein